MIELHLIGYTEDTEHLVLDLGVDGDGRYTVRVDPDLLATVAQVRAERVARGHPVDPAPPEPVPTAVFEPPPVADVPSNGHSPVEDAAPPAPDALLSPAEIQARLREGRSLRAVAEEAGTDLAWIERWLPPIAAERERVLTDAWRRRVDVPGAQPLGASVGRALRDRGVPEDRTSWTATRRADGRWRVSVRFVEDGRSRTATWSMDAVGERVHPASPLADELAAPRRRPARRPARRR